MTPDHVVLWNGTRGTVSGTRYLCATEECASRVEPPAVVVPPTLPKRICELLRVRGGCACRDVAAALGMPAKPVQEALSRLVAGGAVVITGMRDDRHLVANRFVRVYDVRRG